MKHLTSLESLSVEEIMDLLQVAAAWKKDPMAAKGRLSGRIVCTAFFEPSTRTRLSFEAAAQRLGAGVIGFADAQTTSGAKGETLEDTVRVLSSYGDILVMRHQEQGAAARAAKVSDVPVVNAGDGAGEHPTQTLLDLLTLQENLGRLEGITVGLVGDLRFGRTVHSLTPALQRLGATVLQVPAPGLALPAELEAETTDLDTAAATCDALYVTRVQKERLSPDIEYGSVAGRLRVDRALLERTGSKAIVLHPLPRVDEVSVDLDGSPAAKYFEQVKNGVPIRMAVLSRLLEESS